jgi:hypothetical protein
VIRENLDIGRPSQVQLIFDRRVSCRTPEPAGLMLVGAGPIGLSMLKRRRAQPPEL